MTFNLPELPYRTDALEPFLSKKTLETHHGKHHRGYIDKLNKLIEGTHYEDLSLHEIVVKANDSGDTAIFNNAAQSLNHSFLWESMSPEGGSKPVGPTGRRDRCRLWRYQGVSGGVQRPRQFHNLAVAGSGLSLIRARLKIVQTGNADTPIQRGVQPTT